MTHDPAPKLVAVVNGDQRGPQMTSPSSSWPFRAKVH